MKNSWWILKPILKKTPREKSLGVFLFKRFIFK